MQIIFGFITFLYLKIICGFMFPRDLTILSALLIGICMAVIMFFAQFYAARRLDRHPLRYASSTTDFAGAIAPPFTIAIALCVGAALLITHGFSKEFARYIFASYRQDELIWFCLVCALPPVTATAATAAWFRKVLKPR